jgi:hypothetical protein
MSIRTAIEKKTKVKTHIDLIEPGHEYKCETCDSNLIAKRGSLMIYHFAHEHARDCDTWREPKSVWHLLWQDLCLPCHVEVSFQRLHQADIVNKAGTVIEVQNSPMSVPNMQERESFYQDMIWIMNATSINDQYAGKETVRFSDGKTAILKVRHEFWLHCKKAVFIHTDHGIFRVMETLGKKYCLAARVKTYEFLKSWFDGILAGDLNTINSKIPASFDFSNASIRSTPNGLIVKGDFEERECRQLTALAFVWRLYPHKDWFRPNPDYKSEFARLQDAARDARQLYWIKKYKIRRDKEAEIWKVERAKQQEHMRVLEELRLTEARRLEEQKVKLEELRLTEARRLEEEKKEHNKQAKEQRLLEKRAVFTAFFAPRRKGTTAFE